MSEIDLTSLQAELEHYKELGRSGLLPALHAAQKIYGWLPEEVAAEVAKSQQVPLADVHGVIEFYSLFYNKPVGKRIIRICTDQACALKGGQEILTAHCAHYRVEPGQTTPDGATTIESAPCLGLCDHAPAAMVNDDAETDINLHQNTWKIWISQHLWSTVNRPFSLPTAEKDIPHRWQNMAIMWLSRKHWE